jgi:hypothetical protein
MDLIEINLTCLINFFFIISYIININKLGIKLFSFINTRANSYIFINIKLA